ncbi:CHAT domain-containing protein [Streptomyces scabiei]|uniref:CHAT domain-containing protein n=1 Tax=Streptomyces scabiei TaxID=1930 RepID=UPI001B323EAE|nr:CHAT domain-containing protein [Streptomyces sp. LBUM 1488]MBP5898009.1 CHAT domain-containing protein [Streptomyces sp. LBUM 1488]
MSFDELGERVLQRLHEYERTRQADIVLGASVLAEAADLWRAAQPANADDPTDEESERLDDARYVLGWLHWWRYSALPSSPDRGPELARVIVYFKPLDLPLVPIPLEDLLGPTADPAAQARTAADLLNHAEIETDPVLLDAAISLLTTAMVLGATPNRPPRTVAVGDRRQPEWAAIVATLGHAYRMRYERNGLVDDLDLAIACGEQALVVTPDSAVRLILDRARLTRTRLARRITQPSPWVAMLSDLGAAFWQWCGRSEVVAGLRWATERRAQSLMATPDGAVRRILDRARLAGFRLGRRFPPPSPRVAILSELSIAFYLRYGHTAVLADLKRTIFLGEQALAATPGDDPDRATRLSNLSIAYGDRYQRSNVEVYLKRATLLSEQALAATSGDDPNRALYLSHMGNRYQQWYQRNDVLADLERAIEFGEQALAATRRDDPNRAGCLSNLGLAYRGRYKRTEALADLERAIALSEQALAAARDDDPNRASYLFNLSLAYKVRFDADGQGISRERLRALADQSGKAAISSPVERVKANHWVGALAHAMNEQLIAVELLDAAVALLPSVVPREGGWEPQESRLGEHVGMVGDAVAAHCAMEDLTGAVEVAELGRGVLLAAYLDSRTDLTDLGQAQPELAAQFGRVRDRLNTPEISHASPAFEATTLFEERKRLWDEHIQATTRIEDRKQLWAEYGALLAQIRRHPGFARFVLPPRLSDLRAAAAGGAVVLVNVGRRRGDAIIITCDADPKLVALPDLVLTDAVSYATELVEATHTGSRLAGALRKQRVLPKILGWLWATVVEPVFSALPPDSGSSMRRVWWMPAGPLGLLPLHAAGHPSGPSALDTAISSYTPTLRALAHARTRPPARTRRQLTVALQHTPGLPELPGTVAEAAELHAQHPDTPLLADHLATTGRVLAALPDATWVHFACHATTNLDSPSQGGLRLYDEALLIPDISRLQLIHAELAYLSACSTAGHGLRNPDESIHLASVFQLIGFRHVIASLWPLDDGSAATAARSFYRHLPAAPTADHAATALHRATCELRAVYPDRPDLWAPLVHGGP